MKNNYKFISIGVIAVAVLLVGFSLIAQKNNEKIQNQANVQEKRQDVFSAKQLRKEYDKIVVGDKLALTAKKGTSIKDITKVLGKPIVSSSTSENGLTTNTKEWASGASNELPATLTVNLANDIVIEKSISGLFVPHNKNFVITKDAFNKIQTDGSLTIKKALETFGTPNNLSEYINDLDQTVDSFTYQTNLKGDLGAFYNITFVDGKAVSKTESGLSQ